MTRGLRGVAERWNSASCGGGNLGQLPHTPGSNIPPGGPAGDGSVTSPPAGARPYACTVRRALTRQVSAATYHNVVATLRPMITALSGRPRGEVEQSTWTPRTRALTKWDEREGSNEETFGPLSRGPGRLTGIEGTITPSGPSAMPPSTSPRIWRIRRSSAPPSSRLTPTGCAGNSQSCRARHDARTGYSSAYSPNGLATT